MPEQMPESQPANPTPPHEDAPQGVRRTGGPYVDPTVATREEPGAGGDGQTVPLDEHRQAAEEPDRLASPVGDEQPPRLPFVVVGFGGSAGGIEAFTEILVSLPSDTGMAFVFVNHQPPDRESLLAEVLGKRTRMPVLQVEDGMSVHPNHVYVIRPGRTLTLQDGKLRLSEPLEKRGHGHPVDDFFRSLAADQRERAVAIVLSGLGSNGSTGAHAIKAVGGVCIAQEPESALYPSMPRNLIDQGNADFILRPREIPAALLRFAGHPYATMHDSGETVLREQQEFADVLAILRTRTRQDFSGYKRATLFRRLQRRMGLNQINQLGDYVRLLRNNAAEVQALADDMLIHVTGFFRDPGAWNTLRERVIEPMVAAREFEQPVRCWVTACSSGEEAYTLAMLLAEAMERHDKILDVKIFATDMAERSLAHARAGTFPLGIEGEVTPERIDRFFDRDESTYRVKKELRDMVVFAPQNVLQDPPFSRLDIATCRNLLIYLEPEMQRRVLSLVHFGLRDGGALFLGTSETVGGAEEMFEPIDKRWRIYRRIGPTRHGQIEFPLPRVLGVPRHADRAAGGSAASGVPDPRVQRLSVPQMTERALLDRYTPAAVVIDRELRIVYFHGPTDKFLAQPAGEPTRELLAMAKESVRGAVRTALTAAIEASGYGEARDGTIQTNDGVRRVWVTVAPLADRVAPAPGSGGYHIVTFEERAEAPAALSLPEGASASAEEVLRLNEELARVRDELQNTIEELQTSNEELKASNEEVTSINEELQSSNEELETSKEELQSLNEELTTVNAQVTAKNDELQATSSDLSSLLTSVDIAVIFLDPRMRIRRFTPAVRELVDLISSDMGRPLADLNRKFDDPELLDDAKAVLEKLVPIQREVRTDGVPDKERWFQRRITPYRTSDNHIEGVVITFVDITERRRAERQAHESKAFAESIVETLHEPLLVLNPDLTVKSVNQAFYTYFMVKPAATLGRKIYDLGNGQWNIPELRTLLEEVLPDSDVFDEYRVEHHFEDLGRRVMLLNGRRLDHVQLILLGIRDITAQDGVERALRASEERLKRMVNLEGIGFLTFEESSGVLVDANDAFLKLSGYTREQVTHRKLTWQMMTPPEYIEASQRQLARMNETGRVGPYEKEYFRNDGSRAWMLFVGASMGDGTVIEYCVDITEAKHDAARVRESEAREAAIFAKAAVGLCEVDATGRFLRANETICAMLGRPCDSLLGTHAITITHPDDRAASLDVLRRVLTTGQTASIDKRYLKADGSILFANSTITRLDGEEGRDPSLLVVTVDLTERRRGEERLRESEERFRLLVDGARDFAMMMEDPQGRIAAWNVGAERLLGYAEAEVIGQPGAIIFTAEDRYERAPERELETAAREGRAQDERWHVRKDGTRFWSSGIQTALHNADGSLRGFVKVMRDDTARKEAEDALHGAIAAADEASRMKDEFLATLSHELRTPLGAILLWGKLLLGPEMGENPAARAEGLNAILTSAASQKELIEDLLDVSRITSGTLRLQPHEVDLASLVEQSVEAIAPTAAAKQIGVQVTLARDVGSVRCDPTRIRQVIWNLLSNAVKFTHPGGRVEITLRRNDQDDVAELRVTDNGRGIDPAFLPHIFERFRKGEGGAGAGGLGLGLAIAKQLVEMHDGTLRAHSAGRGKGSAFIVNLPRSRKAGEPGPVRRTVTPTAQPTNGRNPPLERLDGLRILLVEDEPNTRRAMKRLLENAGAVVDEAERADQALERFRAARPGLILSDIGLPDEDGVALLGRIHAIDPAARAIPALALTAFAQPAERKRAIDAGYGQVVTKPFQAPEVLRAIADATRTTRGA